LRSVLERVKEITRIVGTIDVKIIKLVDVKIAIDNPETGSFKLRAIIDQKFFIDIYEFLLKGKVIRYSYALIKENKSVLRYDNAPHHLELRTYPHHKHVENELFPLENPSLSAFISEVKKFLD